LSILSGGGTRAGWGAGFIYNIKDKLDLKADVNGVYRGGSMHNILGGVQYNALSVEQYKLNVFVEGLGGLGHSSSSSVVIDDVRVGGGSSNAFVMALGGGVDWKFSDKYSWRVAEMDYMRSFAKGGGANMFRFQTGVLISLGK